MRIIQTILPLLLITGCVIGGAADESRPKTAAELYFPLIEGTRWEYRSTRTVDGITQVYDPVVRAANPWFEYMVLEYSEFSESEEYYLRHTEQTVAGKDEYNDVLELTLFRFDSAPGESWIVERTGTVETGGRLRERTYTGLEAVDTPTGEFTQCKRFTETDIVYLGEGALPDTTVTEIWLAPSVGPVKREANYSGGARVLDELTAYIIPTI